MDDKKKKNNQRSDNISLAAGIRDGLRSSKGSRLLDTEEVRRLNRGIQPVNMFPLLVLLRTNVIPWHSYLSITGAKKSGKSNLGWAMMRETIAAGGLGVFLGTEPSDGTGKQERLLHDPAYLDAVLYYDKVNEIPLLRDCLYDACAKIKEMDPSGQVPVTVLIDSVGMLVKEADFSNMTPKEQEKAKEENNMEGAQKAKTLKKIMLQFKINYLDTMPMTLVGVNHILQKPGSFGPVPQYYCPGGDTLAYMESAQLLLKRGLSRKSVTGNDVFDVEFRNNKQRLGGERSNLKFPVPFMDWVQDGRTVCGYDWNTGMVNLLTADCTSKTQLKEILTLKKNGQVYTCPEVGVVDVTPDELGRAIQENEEVMEKLLDMYSVNRYYVMNDELA
jgi:hypothetical protein